MKTKMDRIYLGDPARLENTAIEKAKSTFGKIETLRAKRVQLRMKHTSELNKIDAELNVLYSQLSAALDLAQPETPNP